MAALDFPNSPMVGQQYSGTNGVLYQWDGTVWTVPLGGTDPWTVSGWTLTPTDATKTVSVPGGAAGAGAASIIHGSNTAKARIQTINTGASIGSAGLLANRDWTTNTQDDTTKPSWALLLRTDSDNAVIQRNPVGSNTSTALLTLDNAGNLTIGPTTGAGIYLGTSMACLVQSFISNASPVTSVSANQSGTPGYLTAKPSWFSRWSADTDHFEVWRQAPSAGAYIIPLYCTNVGDLVIAGSNATKAAGTTWINPSDPRLKQDIAPYAAGLAEIAQLDPITYRLKAQPDGSLCYGFDAEKVRAVFPECVTETRMKLDPSDEEETDGVLTFDMHPILVAVINALKEVATRLAALEAR